MARIPVSVVPHTHWDREWYSPFQTFRLRLVELLDGLLPTMEADPSYAHFLLDGQMAVVDDYLAIRPEAEGTLRRLNASGRLAMGPWYILMDEFLVSGETMVRDMQVGLERAARFGGAMEVGYLPDMFGHVAQMPQILRQFGFEHAVVWRGVPSTVDKDAFWWTAPDGSTVRAQYLWPEGYGNGADLSDDSKRLVRQLHHHRESMGDFFTGSILWMNGTDHQMPKPYLGRVVAEVNAMQDTFELTVRSLEEHVRGATTDGLPSHAGELRSGARANLLMGVASNRVDVKIAAARAERSIERRAEPLCALFLPAEQWPKALLDEAWLEIIRNSAHDSSCACSHDEVVEAVVHRYNEARQIADGLGNRALRMVAAVVDHRGAVLVNASARARSGVVELSVPGEDAVEGAQVLAARRAVLLDETVGADGVAPIFARFRSQLLDPTTIINRVVIDDGGDGDGDGGNDDVVTITLEADERMRANLVMDDVRADVQAVVDRRPDARFRVRIVQPPSQRVLVRSAVVPGYGWSAWSAQPATAPAVEQSGPLGLTNGIVTIAVDPADGTFSVNGLAGFDRLVDDGDHGDTYNYSPPDDDTVVDTPDTVDVQVLEAGPVRGRIRVARTYTWPASIDDEQRARVGAKQVEVVTTLDVHAGESLVRVTQHLDNQARDHRLRAWFPLPSRATVSTAECAFGTVERPTTAEGGVHEHGLPTQPSRRFVQAGGLTVVHEGLLEYELVDIADDGSAGALALTLLRATGMLSRIEMTYRPMPAGPPVVLKGSQVLGEHTLRYAVAVSRTPGDVDPYALVDDAFLPLEVARAAGIGAAPAHGSALTVTGAEVSALRREAGRLELRVFNPTDRETTVAVEGRTGWLVDLRGRPVTPFEGTLALAPWRIATLRLDD